MESPKSDYDCSSEIIEPVYDSSLSEGLAVAQYYLSKSIKDSTRQQYDRVYDIWRKFCRENDVPEFGESHKPLAACLSFVMMEHESHAKVEMLRAAIANEYRIRIQHSPTTHEAISFLFRGFRNAHPHQRQAKLPITEDILTKMCSQLYQPNHGRGGLLASVVLWRTIWRICLEYHTLGIFSDIVKLKRQDVVYESRKSTNLASSPHLKIIFKGGKNDQYSEGSKRKVAANPNIQSCPVQLTINYFEFLGPSYTGYLVPSCTPKNKPNPDKAVPYSRALSDLKKLLTSLGYDSSLCGEQSGKRGGATSAAANGATDKQLKSLGGWRSDSIAAKYVDLSVPSRILLSEMLQKLPVL